MLHVRNPNFLPNFFPFSTFPSTNHVLVKSLFAKSIFPLCKDLRILVDEIILFLNLQGLIFNKWYSYFLLNFLSKFTSPFILFQNLNLLLTLINLGFICKGIPDKKTPNVYIHYKIDNENFYTEICTVELYESHEQLFKKNII